MTLASMLNDFAVPGVVGLIMLVVGLELTVADFQRVVLYPKAVVTATLGQLVLLPLIAAVLIWSLAPPAYIVAGMVLLAATPGGALSNFYTYLARGNTALSVTLTAISSLISLVTLPLVAAAGFAWLLDYRDTVEFPMLRTIRQLFIMLVVPIASGMLIRARWPLIVARWRPAIQKISLIALAVLVAMILIVQRENLVGDLAGVIVVAISFSLLAMAGGWAVGKAVRLSDADSFTLLLEFAARNLGITAVVGVMVLGRADFIVFATVFFLVQTPILLTTVAFRRRWTEIGVGSN